PVEQAPSPTRDEGHAIVTQPPVRKKQYRFIARSAALEKKTVQASATRTSNEFLPLTYLASSTAMESGTVVRVKLSRSTLISLGLPVNAEGSNEMVRADLVVG